MTKLLSALVAALFAAATLPLAFAQEKKGEEEAMEKKADKGAKKKSDGKKADGANEEKKDGK